MLYRIKFEKDGHTYIIDWLTFGDLLQVLADYAYNDILTWGEAASMSNKAKEEIDPEEVKAVNDFLYGTDYHNFMTDCDSPSQN